MKILNKILMFLLLSAMVSSCELDLSNPNAAGENDVLNTKDGLVSLAVGIRQLYSTSVLPAELNYPAVTTREVAAMTTFSSLEELEDGGAGLASDNERIKRLFASTMRVKGMTENLLAHLDKVEMSDNTRSGLRAFTALFRAKCLGVLAQNWEQVPILNSINNDAIFSPRMEAYGEAISILNSALSEIQATPASGDLAGAFDGIDLENAINAYLARYNLFAGNYDAAITAADAVDLSVVNQFQFDAENSNPIYSVFFEGTIQYNPRDNFGMPDALALDPADGRIAFYTTPVDSASLRGLPIELMSSAFFSGSTAPIPLYLPGEMLLIKAEAYARKGQAADAEAALNQVRNKTAAEDSYGIGAGLTDTYTAGGDMDALMTEIYKNRRAELFLIGTSLEDSRRFGRQEPTMEVDYTTERNRNFYPYSADERDSNPNTPNNPSI